jgi:LytS/YehU family sensor histidine kinase
MYIYNRTPALRNERKPIANSISNDRLKGRPESPPPPQRNNRSKQSDPSRPEPVPAYINLLILSVLVFGFDTGLKITSKWVHSEQLRMNLEKENIETQLAFLKHQVSPHFFMNTLNNIHSLIDLDAVEAKKSVIKLSNLMRHLLYESDNEMSPVKSEVDFIKSYVDLMRLRYSNEVKITLKVPNLIPDKSIPPLLFISLLDNAFKHGISYVSESLVEIELAIKPDKLCFKITNSKNIEISNKSVPGIGIENTRKRLDLLYKENYTLDITDRGNIFITNLTIPI